MTSRSTGYTHPEDVLLCRVYIDLSQDLISGKIQKSENFWGRVSDVYNETKKLNVVERNERSVQSRMQTIGRSIRKLHDCIKQVKDLNTSGASELEVITRAKELLEQDERFKKGFRFDHVWDLFKNFKKFKDMNEAVRNRHKISRRNNSMHVSSSSNNPISRGLGQPSVSIDLTDDDGSGCGVISNEEKVAADLQRVKEQTEELIERMRKSASERHQWIEHETQKLAFKKRKYEDKILMMDLDAISDERIRAIFQSQREGILRKRSGES